MALPWSLGLGTSHIRLHRRAFFSHTQAIRRHFYEERQIPLIYDILGQQEEQKSYSGHRFLVDKIFRVDCLYKDVKLSMVPLSCDILDLSRATHSHVLHRPICGNFRHKNQHLSRRGTNQFDLVHELHLCRRRYFACGILRSVFWLGKQGPMQMRCGLGKIFHTRFFKSWIIQNSKIVKNVPMIAKSISPSDSIFWTNKSTIWSSDSIGIGMSTETYLQPVLSINL